MKTISITLMLVMMIMSCDNNTFNKKSEFKVWGNCNMCKETIEEALAIKGIADANWDKNTKVMQVSYDSTVITLPEIEKKIADAGYDNDMFKSSDSVYNNLHECCHYERKP